MAPIVAAGGGSTPATSIQPFELNGAASRAPTLPAGSHVLVTGGAGFIGSTLAYHLKVDLGLRVTALDNFDPYYSPALKRARQARLRAAGVDDFIEGDLCDDDLLASLFSSRHFTHVASLAAQAGVRYSLEQPKAYVRANVQCFLSLLEALRRLPAPSRPPLIYASSSSVYGTNTKVPFSELDPVVLPESLYAASKRMDEQMAHVYRKLYGLRVTGLRFFTVYGEWGRPDMAAFSLANAMVHGRPIHLCDARRDFTYVGDIVRGVTAALGLSADEEVFNLGNHRTETVARYAEVLEAELGVVANKSHTPLPPGDVPVTFANTSHARSLLGYNPTTTIDEGLHRFVRWFKSADYRPEFADTWDAHGAAYYERPHHRAARSATPTVSTEAASSPAALLLPTSDGDRKEPSLYIYDHTNMPFLDNETLGAYRQLFNGSWPRVLRSQDHDYAEYEIARDARIVLEHEFPGRLAASADEASVVLVALWPFGLCMLNVSGLSTVHPWEVGKGVLQQGGCPELDAAYAALASSERYRRHAGRDHAILVENPRREAYGAVREAERAILHSSMLIGTEDRRARATKGSSRHVAVPYYAQTPRWQVDAAASKPTFISFVGSTNVHEHCAACASAAYTPAQLRERLVDQLKASCAAHSTEQRCVLQEPSTRDAMPADEADELVRLMRGARFCPVPRGDTAGSKRLFSAILSECVPVVVSDHQPYPFDDEVRYDSFVFGIHEAEVVDGGVDVYARLANVSAARLAQMQGAMRAARQEVTYAPHGVSAVEEGSGLAVKNLLARLLRVEEEAPEQQQALVVLSTLSE